MLRSAAPRATFERVFPLEDITVRSEGDGRTVEAYAAVFDRAVPVSDWEGEYEEVIRSGAFRKTIKDRRSRFQVFYNHGKDIYGMPAERYAMPIGVPVEVREDSKGVWTVTRYAATDLADEVLELIKAGAIRGQSFGGRWVVSKETRPARAGRLALVERLEVDMREYGPTPFPAYEAAVIAGVRSEDVARQIAAMSPDERADLARLLTSGTLLDPAASGTGEDEPPPPPDGAAAPAVPSGTPDAGTQQADPTLDVELARRRLALA